MNSHDKMRLAQYLSFFKNWQVQNPHTLRTTYALEQNGSFIKIPNFGIITELTDFCSECAKPIAIMGAQQNPPVSVSPRLDLQSQCEICKHPLDTKPDYDWIEHQSFHDKSTFVPNANHIAFLILVLEDINITSSSLNIVFELCEEWKAKL